MSKVFLTKEKNNSYYYTPSKGHDNDREDTIRLNVQEEEAELNRSIEENQDLEEANGQSLGESASGPSKKSNIRRLLSLRSSKASYTVEASSLDTKTNNSNSSNEIKANPVVVQNKAPNTETDQGLTARIFNLKDPVEKKKINQGYQIDPNLASSDCAKKMINFQKSITQQKTFEGLEVESQPINQAYPVKSEDVALLKIESDLNFDGTDSQEDEIQPSRPKENSAIGSASPTNFAANASRPDNLVESYTATPAFTSGQVTPTDDKNADDDVPNYRQYNDGILSSLARLYSIPLDNSPHRSDMAYTGISSQAPGILRHKMSTGSHNSRILTQESLPPVAESHKISGDLLKSKSLNRGSKRGLIRRLSSATLTDIAKNKISKLKLEEEVKITIHIAETQSRQNYLLKLCRALMAFGAPTHRLEEYLRMSARVLEVQGSFLYIPGCMIISFDDAETHSNEVKLVKVVQALNLGLLVDVHEIYKEVVHDVISVEEATQRLDKINGSSPLYNPWTITLIYGFASAFVAPWAFQGRYIDMPICFVLGSIVGFLQHVVAPKCDLYNNVFEIAATVITSFLARAFGSIQNGNVFCFSAIAQSSLALMLPGYIVLCGCLEIQSKSLIAGSVRMVYGIIYSFFLGFGISVGTAFYGLLDPNATNATTCHAVLSDHQKWVFVPIFTLCAGLVNHARFRQLPVMIIIGFAGYIVNFLTFKRFPSSAQISNTLGALTVGLLGNFYGRMRHGVAAAAIVPALLVLVPSGIAASGSLLAGLSSADKITTGTTSINGTSTVAVTSTEDLNKIVFNVGNSMVQIAIGLTVGLFMSTLLVYPLGKRRSGLFAY